MLITQSALDPRLQVRISGAIGFGKLLGNPCRQILHYPRGCKE